MGQVWSSDHAHDGAVNKQQPRGTSQDRVDREALRSSAIAFEIFEGIWEHFGVFWVDLLCGLQNLLLRGLYSMV